MGASAKLIRRHHFASRWNKIPAQSARMVARGGGDMFVRAYAVSVALLVSIDQAAALEPANAAWNGQRAR
jgi:hypothetical protein